MGASDEEARNSVNYCGASYRERDTQNGNVNGFNASRKPRTVPLEDGHAESGSVMETTGDVDPLSSKKADNDEQEPDARRTWKILFISSPNNGAQLDTSA